VDDAQCEVCQAADETAAHIIFECNNARQFWNALGIQTEANWPIEAIKEIQAPSHIPGKYFTTFLLLGCWHIWKRRKNNIFRDERTTLTAA
jgi:hypothetical protein